MPIESPQHRPPHDMNCPMLQIATGCTHEKCRFCDIFNGVPFAAVPMDEVIADIKAIARQATALTRRIYLTGGNPFALPVDRLMAVFDEVERRIPTVKGYGGFCRIMDIARKSNDELAALAARGVDEITIGAESGLDEALSFMEKGHMAADIIKQGQRLRKAGIRFTFFYLAGMAGAGHGMENALASAEAFSAAGPSRILVVTLTPTKCWPLASDLTGVRRCAFMPVRGQLLPRYRHHQVRGRRAERPAEHGHVARASHPRHERGRRPALAREASRRHVLAAPIS